MTLRIYVTKNEYDKMKPVFRGALKCGNDLAFGENVFIQPSDGEKWQESSIDQLSAF